jgi:hypothetical protein
VALTEKQFRVSVIKHKGWGGWGFERWLGMEQKPYGKDADFVQEFYSCHTPMKHND